MSVTTAPHLNFRGDAREALEFYQKVSGGDLAVITYQEMGTATAPDEVVRGQVRGANGFHVILARARLVNDHVGTGGHL